MDNLTHGLLGYTVYAVSKQPWMEKNKKYYALSAILGAEISDMDAYTYGNLKDYLSIHRGIAHAIVSTPLLALLACLIAYLLSRGKRKELAFGWMYGLSLFGMVTHWMFDWFNTWGTGLFEPFNHSRYSLGILPIIDPFLLLTFAIGLILRKYMGSKKAFRTIGSFILVYLLSQAAQNIWIKQQVAPYYDHVTVAAGFIPGQFTVVGKTGNTFEIYGKTLFSEGAKTIIRSTDDPIIVAKAMMNDTAKTIAWWSPFYAITLEKNGHYAMVFDPRFYKHGDSFVKAMVELGGD